MGKSDVALVWLEVIDIGAIALCLSHFGLSNYWTALALWGAAALGGGQKPVTFGCFSALLTIKTN